MGKNNGFEFAGRVSTEQAAEYLERVAAGLRAGHIGLGAGGRRVNLVPAGIVKLELEAEGEEGEGAISMELSWKPAEAPAPTLEILAEELGITRDGEFETSRDRESRREQEEELEPAEAGRSKHKKK
jgi:amphi-Trp domain-containing protein